MKNIIPLTRWLCLMTFMLSVLPVLSGCSEMKTVTMSPQQAEPAEQAGSATETSYLPKYPNFPTAWWPGISHKPDSWYCSEEGIRIAENILSWQDKATGGWPLMNTTREMNTGDPNQAGPWGVKGALVGSTINEIRFLARAFQNTGDKRYKTALIDGIHFILNAQYPSGGWPHVYPVPAGSYHRYATYNDDEMSDLMGLLDEVATIDDFNFLDVDFRNTAARAFDNGVDFILKSQIVVNGQLTAWCQQHDEVTYEPRPARAFEPAAITGGESAGVLILLMSIEDPSPGVVSAVEAGVLWYRQSQIDGLEYVRESGDSYILENPDAPPLWARFYEIETNRPIFAGRDGVIKYNLVEIEQERRAGYMWYTHNGTWVFRVYDIWKAAHSG
jgi:PelA/Pel-15E family pectate lyase